MKKLTLLSALLAMVFTVNAGEMLLRAMTFNLRCPVEADGVNQWKFRKDIAADLVRFHDPDVWGAQEATKTQIDDLLERLPDYDYIGVGRDDGKQGGEHAPIFYKRNRFVVEKSGNFWIAEPEKMNIPGSKGWDSDYPRVTTWAVMLDKVSGKRFFYMNTHLDHIGRDARHEGAKLLLAQAARLSEGLPVMVSGDFNATPKDDPILVMTDPTNPQSLINTRRSAKFVYGPDWSFHDFGRIKPSERPWLDYIFVDRRWTALTCACLSEYYGELFPTDHCPVLVVLSLK